MASPSGAFCKTDGYVERRRDIDRGGWGCTWLFSSGDRDASILNGGLIFRPINQILILVSS